MRRIRSAQVNTELFIDSIDYQDGFQTLDLNFTAAAPADTKPWPKVFESHLHGMPPLALCKQLDKFQKPKIPPDMNTPLKVDAVIDDKIKTQPLKPGLTTPPATNPKHGVHYRQFSGSGTDAEPFDCRGILHPLPPQQGIPGWQRITFMKYFPTDSSSQASFPSSTGSSTPYNGSSTNVSNASSPPSSSAADWSSPANKSGSTTSFTPINPFNQSPPQVDDDLDIDGGCWAYEGVVLPGGKIILGRWWSPMGDDQERICMGPFIFWEVDRDP